MSSSVGAIGSTLTGGIQDVAGLLPLLGTEQCSFRVSSAMTRGYLYAASTPMSIFGSLGLVNAGFKTWISCLSFGNIEGAKILASLDFEPQDSLIMVELKGKNAGRYIIENRIDDLIEELDIDINRITGVFYKSAAWNVKLMATTALLCALSITPYIYMNLSANNLTKSTIWVFPVLRSTGGFITATFIQLVIQQRITTLADKYLVRRRYYGDVEAKKHQMVARRISPTWLLQSLLLIGLVSSLVGYVGCFSVVQNSTSTFGPLSWLCLEAGLSVIRLAIWVWIPTTDLNDIPSLEITFELDKYGHIPLPTCNKDNKEILLYKVLPLTRARDFLKIITSFAGIIEPFRVGNPDLYLYYTLTRNRDNDLENAVQQLGEQTLYITVFDHKERTTRVYTRVDEGDIFYSTKSDVPLVDVRHFLLEVEIDTRIDPKGDPVSSDIYSLDSLRKHHRSILENIQYRLGASEVTELYAIENSGTMKVEDTIGSFDLLKYENWDDWRMVVEKGKEEERNEKSLPLCDYFMHSSIERERRWLDEKHVEWIARRMEMITKEMKERFEGGMGLEYRVNKKEVKKKVATKSKKEIEQMLRSEQYLMELLLLHEVKEWEELFWKKFRAFLDQIGRDRVEEKEILTKEWRANCWKRLNPQMHAVEKRWADLVEEDWFLNISALRELWSSSIQQLVEGVENSYSISLSDLRREMEPLDDDIRLRMEKEIEDTQFRLKRGFDLGRFDQFWDDDSLFECRYSRSKWLYLRINSTVPLDIYSRALKGNKNITHITFSHVGSDSEVDWFQSTICDDLPWVNSISFGPQPTPPAIHRDLQVLFIKSTYDDLITFANEIRPKLDPDSTYIFTDAGHSDMSLGQPYGLGNNSRVLISFVAPTFGQSLILRLKHSGKENGPLEVTLGSTVIQLNPSSQSSLTIDDITLYPIPGPSESDHLSFEPGIRNEIVIQFRGTLEEHGHVLHDIELLDEDGREYPRNEL